jgi:DNA-binding transcriptional LysR family regulator
MAPEFASHWLASHLVAFRAEFPQLELQILVGTRQRDLSRGEAELAIQSPRPRQQGVVAVRMARVSLGLYASKALAAAARWRVVSVATLRGAPLLVYTPGFRILQDEKWFAPLLESAEIALQTNSTHALLAAAQAGVGVAVLPRFVARWCDDLVSVSDDVAANDVWLITHPEFRRDPKVRATTDFLKRVAAEGLEIP